jgi:CBS domain-containing protein
MRAADIMTLDPMYLSSDKSVAAAIELCREYDVRHVPIVDRGTLVGMVSSHDLSGISTYKPSEKQVGEIMSTAVLCINPETDVGDVIDLMIDNKVGAIPVIEGSEERLIGIVSYIDVLNSVRQLVS